MPARDVFIQLAEGLAKGGDDAIGHTPSGKPVMAAGHASYKTAASHFSGPHTSHEAVSAAAHGMRQSHPGYSASDHLHAAEAHAGHAASGARSAGQLAHFMSQAHAVASVSAMGRHKNPGLSPGKSSQPQREAPIAKRAQRA